MFKGGFPGGSVVKNPPANAGNERGFIPWVRKTPWRRKWQPTPVFLPGKPMDRGAWRATVRGVPELDRTERLCTEGRYQDRMSQSRDPEWRPWQLRHIPLPYPSSCPHTAPHASCLHCPGGSHPHLLNHMDQVSFQSMALVTCPRIVSVAPVV